MNWYVLFVMGGHELKIRDFINQHSQHQAFVPETIKFHRKQGMVTQVRQLMFPSYVLVTSEVDDMTFAIYVNEHLKGRQHFIKQLKHDRDATGALYPQEIDLIERLTGTRRIIEPSIGFIEGEHVVVTEGPLIGYESQIIKIDRHKREALLAVEFMGRTTTLKVALSIINKT